MSTPMEVVSDISVEFAGLSFRLLGRQDRVSEAVVAGLAANGARPAEGSEPADLLIVAYPVLPQDADGEHAVAMPVHGAGRAMAERGSGRIVFLLSAMAALPMRRHVDYSVAMAAAFAGVRGLAMQLGPAVLVNAVGAGAVESNGELVAGDRQMLSHAPLGCAGSVADIVNAVLFLCDPLNSYTTGQILNVDGGWSVGYGRNF